MSNSGQVCCATSRILVHENVYEAFVEKFVEHTTKASIVGDPFDESTSHGPQVSKLQYERVMQYVERGKAEGAKLVLGGTTPGGNFVVPTVFQDVEVMFSFAPKLICCCVLTNASRIIMSLGVLRSPPLDGWRF